MVRIKTVLSALSVLVALIGYLPLAPYLDPLARWLFPASLAAGLLLQARGRFISGRILTPASIAVFLYFASGFSQDRMLVVTADLLVAFLAVRMLGEKSGRNYLQVFALALFCLAASSLYNLSALFLVYLLVLLLVLAVSLVILTFHSHDPEIALNRVQLKKVLTVSCLMPVVALPILLFLFVFLPRTQRPLWDFLNRGGATSTGFSDTVRPGDSSTVATAKTVAFRAICPKVPDASLYWRGIVLNGFKDNAWVRLPMPQEHSLGAAEGATVHQEIYPEPSRTPYLLALNVPSQIQGIRRAESNDTVFTSTQPMDKRTRYEAESTVSDAIRVKGGIDREFYLRLPATVSPRLRAQAKELSRPGLSDGDKLRLLERFFRGQRIAYATSGLPTGADPIDEFLFVRKKGNCEFFASSGATLLRLAGVPARLVGGYRGGNYNELGGYYLVTDDLAHVWVEAFLEGRGWVTVDPTAWSIGFARQDQVARALRMYFDAVGFYWNKAVITYDLDKQMALIRSAGSKAQNLRLPDFSARRLASWWPWLLSLLLLAVVAVRRTETPEARLLRRFLKAAGRRFPALVQQPLGLYEMASRTNDPQLRQFVAIYGAALYSDRRLRDEELAKLKEIVRDLNQHRS